MAIVLAFRIGYTTHTLQISTVHKVESTLLTVEIRPLEDHELIVIEHFLAHHNNPNIHAERLAQQHNGTVTYLVAWRDDMPMGHLLIRWSGPPYHLLRERVEPVPFLEDLFVLEAFRSLEVGGQLAEYAENLIHQAGYGDLGLVLAVNNEQALAICRRRGFVESDAGTFMLPVSTINSDGDVVISHKAHIYVTKQLQ